MPLDPTQTRYVEQALLVVPKALAAFYRRYPTLRKQYVRIDSTSVAYLAICKAAMTYDPARSQVTTYFSTAIRNAVLKEIDRNRRLRYDSPDRVSMERAEGVIVPPKQTSHRLQAVLARLPPAFRRLLHSRFYRGLSLRELGEQAGCDPRTIGRRIDAALSAVESLLRNESGPL